MWFELEEGSDSTVKAMVCVQIWVRPRRLSARKWRERERNVLKFIARAFKIDFHFTVKGFSIGHCGDRIGIENWRQSLFDSFVFDSVKKRLIENTAPPKSQCFRVLKLESWAVAVVPVKEAAHTRFWLMEVSRRKKQKDTWSNFLINASRWYGLDEIKFVYGLLRRPVSGVRTEKWKLNGGDLDLFKYLVWQNCLAIES